MLDIARRTAELVELGAPVLDEDLLLVEDYAYPAYGVPSEATKDAIRLCARLEGMITDPVYEGKSMQGVIDLVRRGYFPKGFPGALRPPGRGAGHQRLQLRLPQRMRDGVAAAGDRQTNMANTSPSSRSSATRFRNRWTRVPEAGPDLSAALRGGEDQGDGAEGAPPRRARTRAAGAVGRVYIICISCN